MGFWHVNYHPHLLTSLCPSVAKQSATLLRFWLRFPHCIEILVCASAFACGPEPKALILDYRRQDPTPFNSDPNSIMSIIE
uniref:Uncharacterized protein n=1 Tax=Nelumbo nucifera TaxID=4432 RepID=A0A822YVU3_NELNU|nr:TPA_asm: hypothetical protein HUJ06_007443 [Nelumbo nucifera]